jgi:ABC-type multidrug transport system fused ATPase/permease subunit
MMDSHSRLSPLTKLWRILDPRRRRAAIVLGAMILVGTLFETLSIGLVIPALGLMSRQDFLTTPGFAKYLAILGSPSREELVAYGMAALFGVYALKASFLGLVAWRQSKFVFDLEVACAARLFKGYLNQSYVFHLQHNSAHLLRNATTLVAELSQTIQQTLLLVTEVCVMAGITLLLLVTEPVGAILVVSLLGGAGWAVNQLVRKRMLVWGRAREFHENQKMQHLQQGLGGIRDVKLSGRETFFQDRFVEHAIGSGRVSQRRVAMKSIPRLWLELLAVGGLAGLVLVMLGRGKAVETLLPTLGLFAAAAFRLMPSVNRIIDGLQSLRFNLPVINVLHEELGHTEENPQPSETTNTPVSFTRDIKMDVVTFRYPQAQRDSLCELSLVIPKGASVGFIGGSGAGKSTLIDVLTGLLHPSAGAVRVDDLDIAGNLRGWQSQIGYVPQSIYLTDDTLRRNVAFGVPDSQIDEAAVRRAIRAAQLDDHVATLLEGLNTLVGERGVRLSGGQRQRIGIARALYHDPQVLVLDEATSALDADTEAGVMEAVGALHGAKTILIVAHRLSTVAKCDQIYRLDQGRIVQSGSAHSVLHGDYAKPPYEGQV